MQYYSEDMRVRWDGAIVHKDNWSPRNIQDNTKAVPDDTSVQGPRLPPTPIFVDDA